MNKKVDVLLATYNGEKFLADQIESILNQSYRNIRLIISDDCSKDNTKKLLEKYEQKDERVKVFFQEKNLGLVKNFEFLLGKVENELYMLSDQDDVWLPNKIEKSVETLEKKDADLVFGDLEVVDKNLKTMYPSFGDYMKLNRKIKKYINSYKVNYLYNCVTGCTVLSKKKFIDKIIPFPTDSKYLIHDYWIGLIVGINGNLAYMEEKYIKYRQHGNNQVGTNKISHKFERLDQVRKLFLDVKLGVFGTYVNHKNDFPKEIQELNEKAYEYFKMLTSKKNCNFRNWGIFYELYKTETFSYYMMNFVIMNLPFLGRGIFRLRYKILKILNKR